MAIAVDNVTSNSGGFGISSISAQHICTGTSSNGVLIVAVSVSDTTLTDRTVSSVTHNEEALTHLSADADDGAKERTEIWYRANPTTGGTPNIEVTCGGSCDAISYGAISLTGVNNSSFVLQTATGDNTPPTLSITTISDSSYVIDALAHDEGDGTKIGTVHIEIHKTDIGTNVHGSQYVNAGGAGAQTMNYTDTDQDNSWALSAVSVQIAGAPPSGTDQWINKDDVWHELSETWINKDDVWRKGSEVWINKDDVWRKLF